LAEIGRRSGHRVLFFPDKKDVPGALATSQPPAEHLFENHRLAMAPAYYLSLHPAGEWVLGTGFTMARTPM